MRHPSTFLLLVFLTVPAAAQRHRAVPVAPAPVVPGIEGIARQALENVPGLSIAVRKGNAYFAGTWGEIDVETHAPVRTDSVFQIASVSKQFTAAAILKLAEEGKLAVDDPVRRFIPELDGRFDPITLRHLLTHTSGVPDYMGLVDDGPKTQAEILTAIMSRPPLFAAGWSWQYSNSGYFLLGVVIERASNRTYAQYLRDSFFGPLQMDSTSYCGEDGPLPVGYGKNSRTGAYFVYEPMDPSLIFSAGGLCSTASDLLRWHRGLRSGLALSPRSYAAMTGEAVGAYIGASYGFGYLLDTLAGHRRVWHNGLIFGFQSHFAYFPDDDLTVVVLVNYYHLRDRAGEIGEQVSKAMLAAN